MKRFREIKETRPLCEAVSCEKNIPVVRDFESLPQGSPNANFVDPYPGDREDDLGDNAFVDPYPGGGEIDQDQDGIFFDPFPGA